MSTRGMPATGLIRTHHGVTPRIADGVFIAETAVLIGDVEIAEEASVWYGAVLRGDVNRIRIGRGTNVQDGTVIHVNHDRDGSGGDPTTIGAHVTIGHLALLHACTVGDNAFVGMRAVLLDHVVVEPGAMVAAGAVVTPGKVVRSGQLWAGTPAKHFRDLTPEEIEGFAYSARHYAELAQSYIAGFDGHSRA